MGENIIFQFNPGGVAELIISAGEMKQNVLSAEVMEELDKNIRLAENTTGLKLLVIKSGKPGSFIAGADIHEIEGIKTPAEAEEKSRLGQNILNRLEKLPFPKVAVIDGPCLGGGLELALACDFRVVSDSKSTQLGLPEVSLGVMPGFGGSYRLPRLVGLKEGLSMILSGRPVDGAKAVRIKLADAVYPQAFLDDKAAEFIQQVLDPVKRKALLKKRKQKKWNASLLENNPIGRSILFSAAKKDVLKKTRGFYPAPLMALSVIKKNRQHGLKKALMIEKKGFGKLAATAVSKKLITVFFTGEELKKAYLPKESARQIIESEPVRQAGVLGAGKMGGGIAWLFSNSDIPIRMKDISWGAITAGYKAIRDVYKDLKRLKKADSREIGLKMHQVTGTIDYTGFGQADVVIEAIIEDLDIKKKTIEQLETIVRPDTIIATNTSSLSVDELSSGMKHPERFLGFHFFNPVSRMPLIEVVKGSKTNTASIQRMIALARKLKKTPILVNDTNGFLVNRVLMAYLNEALLLLEEGAGMERIDRIIYRFGLPMGPFTLMDEIGIKVGYKVAKILTHAFPDRSGTSRIYPVIGSSDTLGGRSSGKGFFLYDGKKKTPNPEIEAILTQQGIVPNPLITDQEILDRCILRMLNEAAQCLQEGIVDTPAHLDMALILGIGFPPFRGGILRYADDIGIGHAAEALEFYTGKLGKRFQPARLLLEMKSKERRFYL